MSKMCKTSKMSETIKFATFYFNFIVTLCDEKVNNFLVTCGFPGNKF